MVVQGHPRSLISVPIESSYATFYQSSIATLLLSCPVSINCRFSAEKSDPTPIPPEFWGVLLWLDCWCCSSDEWRPSSNYSCNYIWTNPTHTPTVHQRHRQTDGRTTYCIFHVAYIRWAIKIDMNCYYWHGQTVERTVTRIIFNNMLTFVQSKCEQGR